MTRARATIGKSSRELSFPSSAKRARSSRVESSIDAAIFENRPGARIRWFREQQGIRHRKLVRDRTVVPFHRPPIGTRFRELDDTRAEQRFDVMVEARRLLAEESPTCLVVCGLSANIDRIRSRSGSARHRSWSIVVSVRVLHGGELFSRFAGFRLELTGFLASE